MWGFYAILTAVVKSMYNHADLEVHSFSAKFLRRFWYGGRYMMSWVGLELEWKADRTKAVSKIWLVSIFYDKWQNNQAL